MLSEEVIRYSESRAYPTIGVILLGGISDKTRRIPRHTSAGFAYTGLDRDIWVDTRVMVNNGKPFGDLNGEEVQYSETGRSPFVILNHYRESIFRHLDIRENAALSFRSRNVGILSGSSDAGAAAMGSCISEMAGGIEDLVAFENELRTISESVGRSLHGGLTVTWADGKTARTERILGPDAFRDYVVIGCSFNAQRKPSDRIHENQVGSPEYSKRIENTANKAKQLVSLAENRDIKGIFDLSHMDTLEYHKLNESVGVRIITPEMRKLMDLVDRDRQESWMSYIVTGGSNVFVITEKKNLKEIAERYRGYCDGQSLLTLAEGAKVTSSSKPMAVKDR